MKKIINGKMYNTETATEVYFWSDNRGWSDFRHEHDKLYRKKTGEFFLWGEGGPMTRWAERDGDGWTGGSGIVPFTVDEAKEFLERHDATDEYIALFGEPEE